MLVHVLILHTSMYTCIYTQVKYLYNELESEEVSRWGCAALAAVAYKHTINQSKLTTACNYLADILEVHYKNAVVAREACRAISVLCHGHITNRNKLGMCMYTFVYYMHKSLYYSLVYNTI